MAYPASIDDFTAKTDDVDDVMAADVNELQTAIEAIETELGTDPAGSAADVKTRLSKAISAAGYLNFVTSTELTITSGAVTVTQNFHTIDTESDGPSDDLVTINGGAAGLFLLIRANHADRTVVLKHGSGNIYCVGGGDISLDDTSDFAIGVYDGDLNKWIMALPYGTGAATFLALSDTPSSYAGNAGNIVKVNSGATALEFSAGSGGGTYTDCQGRLTLTTAVSVTTADVTAAGTLYFTPYKGNSIGLYNGATWDVINFTETSLDISGYTASKPYDIWAYNNSGTLALESTIWTNDTTRATALTTQDGVYVKTGVTTRRYLGTIRMTGTLGECEDSKAFRGVFNYYNRVKRNLYKYSSEENTYAGVTFKYFDASDSNIGVIIGVAEDTVTLGMNCILAAPDESTPGYMAIGYDTSASMATSNSYTGHALNASILVYFSIDHNPAAGYHYYAAIERASNVSDTITFSEYYINGHMLG